MNNLLDVLFFGSVAVFFLAMVLRFAAAAFPQKPALQKVWWLAFLLAWGIITVFMVARGVVAHRLPLSNQFEFSTAFAWGIGLFLLVLNLRMKKDVFSIVALPALFLVMFYAALQPKEISDLMPALRSVWFGFHIGSAVFSYASFAFAGCVGAMYLLREKKGEGEIQLMQMDYLSYRLIAFGFLMLTVTILTGCVWAEQAWSAFWSWDPKETWALITWIFYAIYLHQRIRKKWQGRRMAWYAIIAVAFVIFTFAGVNTLLSGLHSYA